MNYYYFTLYILKHVLCGPLFIIDMTYMNRHAATENIEKHCLPLNLIDLFLSFCCFKTFYSHERANKINLYQGNQF